MVFLDEFIATLHDGLDTVIGKRGVLLSGGQKQRVAIARAFLKDAPIIILDEATSALDNKAEAIVQKAIDQLLKNSTLISIAHRIKTVLNSDKILVLDQGEVKEFDSPKELLKNKNSMFYEFYHNVSKSEN